MAVVGRDSSGRFTSQGANKTKVEVKGAPQIRTNLGRFATAMTSAIFQTATEEAAAMQDEMRSSAPWTDRTGRSRQSLYAEVRVSDPKNPTFFGAASRSFDYKAIVEQLKPAGGVTIYLYGTTRGNYFLEILTFPYKGYLGIIRPTARKHGASMMRRLQSKAKAQGL